MPTQLGEVVDYYHQSMSGSQQALEYLEKRGLSAPEVIEEFQLGYCDRSYGKTLPGSDCKEGKLIREQLIGLGVFLPTGHERFRGSITVPVLDAQGVVVQIYGRKVHSHVKKGTPRRDWLPGAVPPLWNEAALNESREIILTDSVFNGLSIWSSGFHNVCAWLGSERESLVALLQEHGTRRIDLVFRSTPEGQDTAFLLAEDFFKAGMECREAHLPRGMDANDVLRRRGKGELVEVITDLVEVFADEQVTLAGLGDVPQDIQADEELAELTEELSLEDSHVQEEEESEPEPDEPQSEPSEERPIATGRDEVILSIGDRRWRVRGLSKNLSFNSLRVNVMVSVGQGDDLRFHVDTFDLYQARPRGAFIKSACEETFVKESLLKKDLGKVLLHLEELQDSLIQATLKPERKEVEISKQDRSQAIELLKEPNLLNRILDDFHKCGVIGEETNKLVGYLAAVSRKLDDPLAIVIQSSSAAGKSSLMESILSFIPPEDRIQFSAVTGQSLYYLGETDLKHKILAIAEEEGAYRAMYALKLLQSEGHLTIASTGKDSGSGRLLTKKYRVEGPVCIFMTTTAAQVEEELVNRCVVLTVDENRQQTRAIHQLQRERQTLEGQLAEKDRMKILHLHRNAQRLLRPLLVANPYARELTFIDNRTRTRRDHMKYLTLIKTIALLHQHQREIKTVEHQGKSIEYIEVIRPDIEIANKLADCVLGRSLDELAPQTRNLLVALDQMVAEKSDRTGDPREECLFTRREIRDHTGWSYDQVRIHLGRLVAMEYVLVHRGRRGHQFVYELLYDSHTEALSTVGLNGTHPPTT